MVFSKVFFPAVFIWDISNNINNILACIQIMLCVAPSLVVCSVLSPFFWPLYCPSFFDWRLLITPLVSFGHCIVCLSLIYGCWWPLWYLQTFCFFYIVFFNVFVLLLSRLLFFSKIKCLLSWVRFLHLVLRRRLITIMYFAVCLITFFSTSSAFYVILFSDFMLLIL